MDGGRGGTTGFASERLGRGLCVIGVLGRTLQTVRKRETNVENTHNRLLSAVTLVGIPSRGC